mgnify:CR=1 FL=1
MAEKYYPSETKYNRAKAVVANYEKMAAKKPGLAEVKLVAEGLAKSLKGEELIDFVYNGLAGAPILGGVEAKEAKTKAKEATARARKRVNAAMQREKITVK